MFCNTEKRGNLIIEMSAGCKHTVIADTELQLIEVQLGTDISVADKKKYRPEQEDMRL